MPRAQGVTAMTLVRDDVGFKAWSQTTRCWIPLHTNACLGVLVCEGDRVTPIATPVIVTNFLRREASRKELSVVLGQGDG